MASSVDRRPVWSCPCHHLPCQRGPHKGKERPGDPEGLPLPLVPLFSPVVTRAFPWPIKGKAGRPIKGHRTTSDQKPLTSNLEHIAEQRPSSRYPFILSTSDLGHVPLSPFCNPYYQLFSGSNTSSSNELDIGTFRPNQYKPHVLLAHHPSQTRNNTNLLVGVYSKHQHQWHPCGLGSIPHRDKLWCRR